MPRRMEPADPSGNLAFLKASVDVSIGPRSCTDVLHCTAALAQGAGPCKAYLPHASNFQALLPVSHGLVHVLVHNASTAVRVQCWSSCCPASCTALGLSPAASWQKHSR